MGPSARCCSTWPNRRSVSPGASGSLANEAQREIAVTITLSGSLEASRQQRGTSPWQAAAEEAERARSVRGGRRRMDKTYESPAAAVADLTDAASIAVSGFGQSAGSPVSLLAALVERGSKDLTLVGN